MSTCTATQQCLTIGPFRASDGCAGTYSIDIKNKQSLTGGMTEKTYYGKKEDPAIVFGDIVESISDLIVLLVLPSYESPTTPFDPLTHLLTLTAFKNYFKGSLLLSSTQDSVLDHIVQNLYPIVKSINKYLENMTTDVEICTTKSNLRKFEVSTCLFCFRFIIA